MITQVECSAHTHRRWQFSETHGTTVKFVLNLCSATGHGPSVHRCNVCYACLLFFRGVFQFCVPPILEKSSQPECAGRGNRFACFFNCLALVCDFAALIYIYCARRILVTRGTRIAETCARAQTNKNLSEVLTCVNCTSRTGQEADFF